MVTKLVRVITYRKAPPHIKLNDLLITFLVIWFSLLQLADSERKCLSRPQFLVFFSSFSTQFLDELANVYLHMFYKLSPKTRVTSTGLVSLNTLKNVCVTDVH